LENLDDDDDDDDVDVNRAWESIRDNMKASATGILGYYDLKQHKPCFHEECSKLLDKRCWLSCVAWRIESNKWR
jgi:hypothetical protein